MGMKGESLGGSVWERWVQASLSVMKHRLFPDFHTAIRIFLLFHVVLETTSLNFNMKIEIEFFAIAKQEEEEHKL